MFCCQCSDCLKTELLLPFTVFAVCASCLMEVLSHFYFNFCIFFVEVELNLHERVEGGERKNAGLE